MAEKYHTFSPYHYVANNPIRNLDIDGNEFTESAWEWVSRLVENVAGRVNRNNEKIEEKSQLLSQGYELDKDGNKVALSSKKQNRLQRQVDRLSNENQNLTQVVDEVVELALSDQVYNVIESSSQNETGPVAGTGTNVAYTSFNFTNGNVDITISSGAGLDLFAHELFHAYQFDVGEISLGRPGIIKGNHFLLDKHDELAGYQRQGLIGSNENVTSINTLPERYNNLPTGPVDVHNYTYQGKSLNQMNQYERQNVSRIITNQAYRYNGQTIY